MATFSIQSEHLIGREKFSWKWYWWYDIKFWKNMHQVYLNWVISISVQHFLLKTCFGQPRLQAWKKLDFRFQKMLEGFSFLPKETCWVIWYESYQCWDVVRPTYSSHWRRAQHPTVVTNFKLPTIVRMLLRKCFTDEIVIVCAVCFKDDGSHSFSNQFSENHHFWCSWGDERLYGKSIITSFV